MREINVDAGAVEYVVGYLTETSGKNIHADPVQASLGSATAPTTWETPDYLDASTAGTIRAGLLIDDTIPGGIYWLWLKLTDAPEIVPRRCTQVRVINAVAVTL